MPEEGVFGAPKKVMNLIALLAIFSFIGVLILESVTLIAGVPVVLDGIENPRVSTQSDIIVPYSGCNESDAISSFEIEPTVNGTFHLLNNHIIFMPSEGLSDGKEYTVTYGCPEEKKSLSFTAEKPKRLDYTLITGFGDSIVIAFNMDVNHTDIDRNISFEPWLSFSDNWYGNTLVIDPESPIYTSYDLKIGGNTTVGGKNYTVNFKTTYYTNYGAFDMLGYHSIPEKESTWLYVLIPPGLPFPIARIYGDSFVGYYLFIVSAILLSLGYIFVKEGKKIIKSSAESLGKLSLKIPADNSLFEISALFLATISFSVIFYYLIMLFNQNPTVPQFGRMPMWEQLYEFARAGVWEEVISRIPFIGLILLLIHVIRGKRNAPIYRYILGGGFKTDRTVLILIFICGFMFGFVHMLGGWDVFKILPAMVGGLAMGYLYTKWGIWASITMHFATDYLSMPSRLFNSFFLDAVINLFLFAGIFIGLYFFYLYSKAFVLHITKKSAAGSETGYYAAPPQSAYPPYPPQAGHQQYPYPYQQYPQQPETEIPYAQYPYRCYICGNTEAEYIGNGLLKCTRCGALSRIPPYPPPPMV